MQYLRTKSVKGSSTALGMARIFFLVLFLASQYAVAASPSPFGLFTNMHLIEDEQDIIGIELFIVDTVDGCHVLFQSAEGEPRKPKLVKCELRGNELSFSLPNDPADYHGTFKGYIGAKGITGHFDSGQVNFDLKSEFFLPRKNSYWQKK